MKTIINRLQTMEGFSLTIGMIVGACVALVLFSYLVPSGLQMTALYHHKMAMLQAEKNNQAFNDTQATGTMKHDNHEMVTPTKKVSSNPYMMSPIKSEKQFLRDMKLHHEAAVVMAKQVLTLSNLHPEVTKLAKDIIDTQTTEIRMMSDWMSAWK